MNTTPVSLLERLRQPNDQEAWRRFVDLYTPLLYYWVKRSGFSQTEADDLVQEVFAHLVSQMPRFQYDDCKYFRGWLGKVARNKWNEIRRRRQVDAQAMNHVEIADEHSPDPAEMFESEECRQALFQRAMEVMQTDFPPNTWQACKRMVMDEAAAADVAVELGMSVGAVHAARFRVLARLRQELAGLVE